MTRLRRALVPALLLALVPAVPATAAPDRHGDPVLLALGDSVPAGVGAVPRVSGYPELLGDLLSDGYNPAAGKATPHRATEFDVVNLAVPGARTDTLAPQVEDAVALVRARRADRDPKNDVEVITLTIGGNDVFDPVLTACLPSGGSPCQTVTDAVLTQVGTRLTAALRQLAAAAGKHTEIVVTTYYNSLLASCSRLDAFGLRPLARQLAGVVLEGGTFGGLTVQSGLNAVIERAAAATGAQVADVFGDVGAGQLAGDCLHPNAEGHEVIAEEVYATLAG